MLDVLTVLLGMVAFACFTLAIYNAIALAKRFWPGPKPPPDLWKDFWGED